ncbi:MAG: glycosyltransferase family 4 protein [Aestuariivirga sp.]
METSATRICIVGLRGIPGVMGGIESHCEQIFPRLKALSAKYDITIIGRRTYIERPPYDYRGLRVVALPSVTNKYFETISNTAIAVFYARFFLKSEILHIHGIGPALMGPLARLFGMKVVVTHHGRNFEHEKWNRVAKAALRLGERCATAAANRVIVVSKSLAEDLRRRHPKLGIRLEYIPNGVTKFPEARREDDGELVLNKFGLETGRYVLAVGRLVPEKGFHVLIEAFKHAHPNHKLAIVGKADYDDCYSRSLFKLASDRIVFCGFQNHDVLRILYCHAALFVLPSTHEGMPVAALEAASLNVPILISDIRPNLDIGLAKANYFPVGDIGALSAKLLEDYASYRVDRNDIASRYDWDQISEATLKVYASLV